MRGNDWEDQASRVTGRREYQWLGAVPAVVAE